MGYSQNCMQRKISKLTCFHFKTTTKTTKRKKNQGFNSRKSIRNIIIEKQYK